MLSFESPTRAAPGNWHLTPPAGIASVLVTSVGLRTLGRMDQVARRRALAGTLAVLSATAVAQSWHRPDLMAEYGRSAFADLGTATFLAAAALLLALAAMRPQASDPPRAVEPQS